MCAEDARTKGMLSVTECSLWELAANASWVSALFRGRTTLPMCVPAFYLVHA